MYIDRKKGIINKLLNLPKKPRIHMFDSQIYYYNENINFFCEWH